MRSVKQINPELKHQRSRLHGVVIVALLLTVLLQLVPAAPAAASASPAWSIRVELSADRWSPGRLHLYDKNGGVVFSARCLGRSEYNTPMNVTYGNTPTGVYLGRLGRVRSSAYSYGPYQTVDLVGVAGIAKTSRRTGILIHGGAPGPGGSLRPSHGCVRLSNQDEKRLVESITALVNRGYNPTGRVVITER
ncbi:MAG: L,D-transpeptidase [Firmicutes bacterium]|nr:L,D-transpeptidase [Bacillota bacterium]